MESPQNIKKRLKSVNNIGQITKAMELVSATKMRKSQQIALDSRPYAFAALDFLATISSLENQKMPPLFEVRKSIKKVLFVLVSSDKGLVGAFNSSVFKKFELHMKRDEDKYKNEEKVYIAVGEKSAMYLQKKKAPILKKFVKFGDHADKDQVWSLADFIIQGYLDKKWDKVVVVSMHFRSALKQEPHVRRILPIDHDHVKDIIKALVPETGKFANLVEKNDNESKGGSLEYLIEPSPELVLESLAKHLLFIQIYHLILEANAAEHSARRMAMKTASDNAGELGDKLNLEYNKSRQAAITKEIIEIVAGAEAS